MGSVEDVLRALFGDSDDDDADAGSEPAHSSDSQPGPACHKRPRLDEPSHAAPEQRAPLDEASTGGARSTAPRAAEDKPAEDAAPAEGEGLVDGAAEGAEPAARSMWMRHVAGGEAGASGPGVPGLHVVPGFLSTQQQQRALDDMARCGWLDDPALNQALCFGELPEWVWAQLPRFPRRLLPPALRSRDPLFDHLLMNAYQPGEGLPGHVDLARFEDGIVSLSYGSGTVMEFRHPPSGALVEVLLRPGTLLVMHGPARYEWTHGIPARESDEWGGECLPRGRRISLTLRRLRADGCSNLEPAP